MLDSKTIVREFISYFENGWPENFELIRAYLADDATFQMVVPTTKPIGGIDAIIETLEIMKTQVPDQKIDIYHIAANGNVVFTERLDHSFRNGQWVEVPLVGVFELNDEGKISQWREYLDMYHNLRQHGVSLDEMNAKDSNYTLAQ